MERLGGAALLLVVMWSLLACMSRAWEFSDLSDLAQLPCGLERRDGRSLPRAAFWHAPWAPGSTSACGFTAPPRNWLRTTPNLRLTARTIASRRSSSQGRCQQEFYQCYL